MTVFHILLQTNLFTSTVFYFQLGSAELQVPRFGSCFSEQSAGVPWHKRSSPTFANTWLHCPWVLLRADTVSTTNIRSLVCQEGNFVTG